MAVLHRLLSTDAMRTEGQQNGAPPNHPMTSCLLAANLRTKEHTLPPSTTRMRSKPDCTP